MAWDAEKVAQPLLAVRFSKPQRIGYAGNRENRTASPSQGLGIKSGCATKTLSCVVVRLHLFLRGGRKQAVQPQVEGEAGVVIRKIGEDFQGCSKARDLLAAEKRDHFGEIAVVHF